MQVHKLGLIQYPRTGNSLVTLLTSHNPASPNFTVIQHLTEMVPDFASHLLLLLEESATDGMDERLIIAVAVGGTTTALLLFVAGGIFLWSGCRVSRRRK